MATFGGGDWMGTCLMGNATPTCCCRTSSLHNKHRSGGEINEAAIQQISMNKLTEVSLYKSKLMHFDENSFWNGNCACQIAKCHTRKKNGLKQKCRAYLCKWLIPSLCAFGNKTPIHWCGCWWIWIIQWFSETGHCITTDLISNGICSPSPIWHPCEMRGAVPPRKKKKYIRKQQQGNRSAFVVSLE